LTILVVIGLAINVFGKDNYYDFPWGTTRSEISELMPLGSLGNPLLEKSNDKFLSREILDNLSLYVAGKGQVPHLTDIAGLDFMTMFGFYKDSLIYIVLSTHEMPYSEKKEKELTDRIRSEIIPKGGLETWDILVRDGDSTGNIFGEECLSGTGQFENTYNELQVSLGTMTDPVHLQYMIFQLDKNFFDRLTRSSDYLMDSRLKEQINACRTFTRFYGDKKLESLKAELKGKK